MELDEPITRRLAFIRYMYKVAVEQSYKAEPLSSISVLTFHDAIEFFLQLSSEYLNVGKSGIGFMEYWDKIDKLTQRESMRRLNKARGNLKHHGILPSKLDIEGFRTSATNFFEENAPIIFDIKFSEISLAHIVRLRDVRNDLKKAEDFFKEGKAENAIRKAYTAYSSLIECCEGTEMKGTLRSPLLNRSLNFEIEGTYKNGLDRLAEEVKSLSTKMDESLTELWNIVRISIWGIDYRKYMKFKILTYLNHVFVFADESPLRIEKRIFSEEEVQFCIDFVIESAITLQEFYSMEGQ